MSTTKLDGEHNKSPTPQPPPVVPQPIDVQSTKAFERAFAMAQVKDSLDALTGALWLLLGGQVVQELILCLLLCAICFFYRRWRAVLAGTSSLNKNTSANPLASTLVSLTASSGEVLAFKQKEKLPRLRELFAHWRARAGLNATGAAGRDDTSGVELSFTDSSSTQPQAQAGSHVAPEAEQVGGASMKGAGTDADKLQLPALPPIAPTSTMSPLRLSQLLAAAQSLTGSTPSELSPDSLNLPKEVTTDITKTEMEGLEQDNEIDTTRKMVTKNSEASA